MRKSVLAVLALLVLAVQGQKSNRFLANDDNNEEEHQDSGFAIDIPSEH